MSLLIKNKESALEYAAFQGNLKSVEMLIEAGWPIPLYRYGDFEPECRRLLISALYDRRRKLKDLAMEHGAFQKDDDMYSVRLFTSDSAARMYLQSLEKVSVAVLISLRSAVLLRGSLYHSCWTSRDYLGRGINLGHDPNSCRDLLVAGFAYLDETWEGLTPLMTLQMSGPLTQVAELHLESGADPDKEIPLENIEHYQDADENNKHRAIHKLASFLDSKHLYLLNWQLSEFEETPRLRKAIFQDIAYDFCFCHCSSGGCSALTCFLKGAGSRRAEPRSLKSSLPALAQLYLVLEQWDPDGHNNANRMELIRMMTFNSLGLTHTCCLYRVPSPREF